MSQFNPFRISNRPSSKTDAKPSQLAVAIHAAKRKDAAGIHNLTPDRVARISAAARTAEYRDRVKNKPAIQEEATVTPVHQPNGPIEGASPSADEATENREPKTNAVQNSAAPDEAGGKHSDEAKDAGKPTEESSEHEQSEQLKNAATAIETVRRQLQDLVRSDARLNVPPAASSSAGIQGSPWVQDIITPDDSGVWTAIVSRPDGKLVKVRFTLSGGVLSLTADEPVETGMEVIYNRADALGILVEAADKLTNRFSVPEDGWIHIAPPGNHAHPKGVVQVLDDRSFEGMVNAFNARKQADSKFPGVLVDFDHFSQSGDKPSEAAGWIENLQRRDDGLWAQVRWTDVGEKAVNGGRYRLVSPVWLKRDCETLDGNKVRPMRLDSVALTNEPNLKGLTPISK
jgi:hypothetical protein